MDRVLTVVFVISTLVLICFNGFWSNRLNVALPITQSEVQKALQTIDRIGIAELEKKLHTIFEIVSQDNITEMTKILGRQYENFDQVIRDFIERMPLNEDSHLILESLSTGWSNTYSIVVMRHKTINGKHKILIAKIEKEVKLTWMETIWGHTYRNSKQIEAILTDSNVQTSEKPLKNTLMAVMVHKLEQLYGNDIEISYSKN